MRLSSIGLTDRRCLWKISQCISNRNFIGRVSWRKRFLIFWKGIRLGRDMPPKFNNNIRKNW